MKDGWGTWIRTTTNRFRVCRPTVRRFPSARRRPPILPLAVNHGQLWASRVGYLWGGKVSTQRTQCDVGLAGVRYRGGAHFGSPLGGVGDGGCTWEGAHKGHP